MRKAITIATREMMIGMVLLVGALLWPMAPTLADCIRQLQALQTMIGAIERRIMVQHRANEASKRIATIPGIGVLGTSRAKPPYTEIQKQIGKGLKEHYELSPELPHGLLALLTQLNEKDDE